MGLFDSLLGGGDKTSTSNSTTAYTPNVPDWLKNYYQSNTQKGVDYGNQISNYTADQLISPFSQDELNAFNMVRQGTGQYQPVFDSSINTMLGVGQQAANGPSADQIQGLMNPYVQNVLNSQRTAAVQEADRQRNLQNQNLQQAGAYGGSRQAVANRELNQNLSQQLDQIQSNGMYNAFQSAMGQYNAGLGQQMQAAQGANTAALQGQGSNLQDVQALQQVGQNERNMNQNILTTNYQQPMQATNYIQQLLNSVPQSMYGYNSNTNSSQTQNAGSGSLLGSLLGTGLSIAGLGMPGGGTVGGSLFSSLIGSGSGGGSGTGMDFLSSLGSMGSGSGSAASGGNFLDFSTSLGSTLGFKKGGLVSSEKADAAAKVASSNQPVRHLASGGGILDMFGLGDIFGNLMGSSDPGETNPGEALGQLGGQAAGNYVLPGIGGFIGSKLGRAAGNALYNILDFADGGIVMPTVGSSSTVGPTTSLTVPTSPLPASQSIYGDTHGLTLLDSLLGKTNSPESKLSVIKAMEANNPENTYGTGSTANASQEDNLRAMIAANPPKNEDDFTKALNYIDSLTGGTPQDAASTDTGNLATGTSPESTTDATADSTTNASSASPLDTALATAGSANTTAPKDTSPDDALNSIMKNTNLPLLAMGLTMLGTHGNFADQLSAGGLKGAGVYMSQQESAAKDATAKQEQDTKRLQLAFDLAKAKSLDNYRQTQLKSMLEDKDVGRKLQQEGLDIKRQALDVKQNMKPPTQKDALTLAQKDPRYLMAAAKAQKGDLSDLNTLQKEYYDRLSTQYISQQNSADSVINATEGGDNKTVNFADIGKEEE